MLKREKLSTIILISLTLIFGACGDSEDNQKDKVSDNDPITSEPPNVSVPSLLDVIESTPKLARLKFAIGYIDNFTSEGTLLKDILDNEDSDHTAFAPKNSAFDNSILADYAAPPNTFNSEDLVMIKNSATPALSDQQVADVLYQVVANHVLRSKIASTSITDGLTLNTLAGAPGGSFDLTFNLDSNSGKIQLNSAGITNPDAVIVEPDVKSTNGFVHIIDKVLFDGDSTFPPN